MKSRSDLMEVELALADCTLPGLLRMPEVARSMVIFSHGSGSSRLSKRNNYVADHLLQAGIGSLLFDLLTSEEDRDYENRFDIGLLTRRLLSATQWIRELDHGMLLNLGYFGASTGAASALRAAAAEGTGIRAVVSRGGRPDLAGKEALHGVRAATLLIVGAEDHPVLELNREAYNEMECTRWMEIIPGATHLFSEEGKMEHVASLAGHWFGKYL